MQYCIKKLSYKERDCILLEAALFHIFQTLMEENASRLRFGCYGKHFAMPSNMHPRQTRQTQLLYFIFDPWTLIWETKYGHLVWTIYFSFYF